MQSLFTVAGSQHKESNRLQRAVQADADDVFIVCDQSYQLVWSGRVNVQVDVTTGTFESSGLNIVFPGLPAFDTLVSSASIGAGWLISADNSEGDELSLDFRTLPAIGSLVGLTEGLIATGSVEPNFYIILADGSITPVPEPSSLVLLAGGIVLLVFGLTRRFRKKSATH